MDLDFDLKIIITVEVDDDDLYGCEHLYLDGIDGISVIDQLRLQYRDLEEFDVAEALDARRHCDYKRVDDGRQKSLLATKGDL